MQFGIFSELRNRRSVIDDAPFLCFNILQMGTPGLEGGVVGAGVEAGTGLGDAGELTEWTVVVSQCV